MLKNSSDVTPGLGGSRNEHITYIMFLDEFYVPPLAKTTVDHEHRLENDIHMGYMPYTFYIAYMATRFIDYNKVDPDTFQPVETMSYCPVSLRKSVL
eukprot:10982330-Ditylum_brightwellii.AAC.2